MGSFGFFVQCVRTQKPVHKWSSFDWIGGNMPEDQGAENQILFNFF